MNILFLLMAHFFVYKLAKNLMNFSDDVKKNILTLLNTGSLKDIQQLWTIGKKAASSIFQYR